VYKPKGLTPDDSANKGKGKELRRVA
jgi:hypothetical protein